MTLGERLATRELAELRDLRRATARMFRRMAIRQRDHEARELGYQDLGDGEGGVMSPGPLRDRYVAEGRCTSCWCRRQLAAGQRTCARCTVRKQAYRTRRRAAEGLPPSGQKRADTLMLRELVLEHVGRVPTPAARLFARVRDDFGTIGGAPVCLRRLWRVLRWQVARGAIAVMEPRCGRSGRRYASDGYVRVVGCLAQRRGVA